ncbi:ATP-binding protein [Streptomyces ipomoeae]|uniref:ATP-binding protein n=1 Tax=Streptomyces ipomoeae TaxID=103232 RepID=A0AAE9AVD9_9ACTN|nr:ATP-binding protein [Streptomyces ipomoeae]
MVELVDNAVQHVGPVHPQGRVTLGMTVAEDEELIISVTDPGCWFDGFDGAVAAQKDSGLGLVRMLGGEISWSISESGYTKTLRVLMKPPASAF